MKKKTFYEVQTAFYDNGKAITNITRRLRANRKPAARRAKLYKCSVRIRYYDTREQTRLAVEGGAA